MIITNAEKRRELLKQEVNPTRIAVAYVGKNWQSYIDEQCLKEIILRPSIGTNPNAVEEIIKIIGIDNVHFLDSLHSKIYLGNLAAILGSCNLSNNGFGKEGNEEAAVILTEANALKQLKEIFNDYKDAAQRNYIDSSQKLSRLEKLKAEWRAVANANLSNGCVFDKFDMDQLKEKENSHYKIHVAWFYVSGESSKLNDDRIRQSSKLAKNQSIESYFHDYMYFHNDDDIRTGDWILSFGCKNDGTPGARSDVSWMFVNEVHPDVVLDDKYSKLVGQVEFESFPIPPFKLDHKLKCIFRETVTLPTYKALLPPDTDNDIWRLDDADKFVFDFICDILQRYNSSR